VTTAATLRKLGVDAVVRGECEDVITALASADNWSSVPSIAYADASDYCISGAPAATALVDLPAVAWPDHWIDRHRHHHHRFDDAQHGAGAEVEASRGCPYNCSFCAKNDYRDQYRRRDLTTVLEEVDRLISQGVGYIYFIDEIFLPQKPLLEALAIRRIKFGVQTRIDLWKPDLLALLGKAGCVSIEAGIESLTAEGREALAT
jgi:B12-binding domain/radical SAM domain protein of rhizo-twelve system